MKMTRNAQHILIMAAFSFTISCSTGGQGNSPTNEQTTADTTGNRASNLGQDADLQDKEYSNPMDFAMSVDSLRTWALLCQYSKWGNDVRSGNYTLLCPKVNLLKNKGKDLLVALRDKKNADVLDKLMAAHLLKTDLSVDKWKYDDILETIDGRSYKVGGQVIQDVVYFTNGIYTKHGNVVFIEGLLEFPEQQLRERISAK